MLPTTKDNPVVVGAGLSQTSVAPGESLTLFVRCQIPKPWTIYAVDSDLDSSSVSRLELQLPEGITTAGPWHYPAAKSKSSPLGDVAIYEGLVDFSIPLTVATAAEAGNRELTCELHFQPCSDTTCLAPQSEQRKLTLSIRP